jgi:hypothetical protein
MISEVLVGVGLIAVAVGSMIYQAHLVKKGSSPSRAKNRENTQNTSEHHLHVNCLLACS